MIFFAGVIAPAVFRFLDADEAGAFLRGVFPRYYDVGLGVSLIGVPVAVWEGGFVGAGVLALVASGFVLSRFVLVSRINEARDAKMAGEAGASSRFKRLHSFSVLINLVQMGALLALILRALGAFSGA